MIHDVVDLHTHTVASGHAYNTLYEMARSAADRGIELLGISDHGPAMEGSAAKHYFRASRSVPRSLFGIQILFGVELNIMDAAGNVDLTEKFMEPLDYAIASLHSTCTKPGTPEENTAAYIGAMRHGKVFILGHPDDGTFEADYDALAREAAARHILIELNEVSVTPGSFRKNGRENARKLMAACRKWHTGVILSSDAHCEAQLLNHGLAAQMLEELDFPEEQIANVSVERTLAFLQERRAFVAAQG